MLPVQSRAQIGTTCGGSEGAWCLGLRMDKAKVRHGSTLDLQRRAAWRRGATQQHALDRVACGQLHAKRDCPAFCTHVRSKMLSRRVAWLESLADKAPVTKGCCSTDCKSWSKQTFQLVRRQRARSRVAFHCYCEDGDLRTDAQQFVEEAQH